MPETPADAPSLTVLAGPLKGRRLVLDDAVDDILIGSDPDCTLSLEVPGVSPIHARLWLDPQGATLYDTHSAAGVYVNDDPVVEQAVLRDGDIVWLGAPAEPDSVMLQFRFPGAPPPAAVTAEDPALELEREVFEESDQPAPEPDAAPAGEGADDWVIEDVADPAEEAARATAEDPLGAVLDGDDLEWPPPSAAPPPAAAPARPAAAAPAPIEDDFFVDDEPAPAAPAAEAEEPAPAADDDMFEWGAAPESGAPAVLAPAEPETAAVDEDPLLLDWSSPSEPPPAATPHPAPAPGAADEDVFYVETSDPGFAPAAPAPAPPPPLPVMAAPPPAVAVPPPPPPAPPPVVAAPPSPPIAAARAAPPPRAAVTDMPSPAPAPRPRPSAGVEAPARTPAPAPRTSRGGMGTRRVMLMAGGAVLALVVAGLIAVQLMGTPRIDSIEPTRVRGGDTIVIQGKNFSTDAAAVVVRFEGQREGRILRAGSSRLEVEVPSIPAAPGRVNRVPVLVSVSGSESKPVEISVYQAPRIHGIAPSVALPGEEVTLAGADWSNGATVKFGQQNAQVIELSPTSIRVRVPQVNAPEGTLLPVVVSMGGDPSNEATFHLGRLPLLLSVEPHTVNFGDPLVIKGLGFAPQPSANDLRVGGTRAVVVKAGENELLAVVPRTPADGQNAVELRVPNSDRVGQSTITVAPPADPIDFRFFVEHPSAVGINDPANGHDHVVLSTGLGPAFLISAAEGVSAAERAAEAQRRLNEAAATLRATLTADLEVRGLDSQPSIGLVGKQEPLLVVTADDAAAYEEDWARGRGKGETVTPARLAIWWGAVARDLVLMLVRGDKPRYAAALAPEGRVLLTLNDAARRAGRFGVPREAVNSAPAALKQALRGLAFHVPAAVKAPVEAGAVAAPVQALTMEGMWTGSEVESGSTRYITVQFSGNGGTFTYERALSVTIPLQSAQQTGRREIKFDFRSGIHLQQYQGTWDGHKLRGKILSEDGAEIGQFELEHKR